MAYEKSVTAILVAYNSAGVIAKALQPLLVRPEIHSIMVVDNCSTDETCDLIKRDFPAVQLIENPRNDGFGRGNNIGLNRTQTPYALLLNPDAVLQAGAIEALLAAAQENPNAAILAPALYDEEGHLHKSYKRNVFEREKNNIVMPAKTGIQFLKNLDHGFRRDDTIDADEALSPDVLPGAAWLLNMKLMRQVGFFDPKIFLYYEDDDLCLRVHEKGYGLVYVPAAHAVHVIGTSSGEIKIETEYLRQRHMAWSRLYIEEKYRGKKAVNRLAARLNIEYSLKAAYYFFLMRTRRTARYRGRLQGIFDYLEKRGA